MRSTRDAMTGYAIRCAASLAVSVSLVGCGGSGSSAPGTEATASVPGQPDGEQQSAPEAAETASDGVVLGQIDVYAAHWYTPAERSLVNAAWEKLYDECVMASGYTVAPLDTSVDDDLPDLELHGMLFDDVALIQQYGYGWLSPQYRNAQLGHSNDAPAEDRLAIDDATDGRCIDEANAPFGGAADEMENQLLAERAELGGLEEAKWAESKQMTTAWESCMRDEGFPDASFGPTSQIPEWVMNIEVQPGEREFALADYECRGTTGYRDSLINYWKTSLRDWERENEGFVIEVDQYVENSVEIAKQILA